MLTRISYILILFFCFSTTLFSQNINLIIQVNDKLVIDGISSIYLKFGSGSNEKRIPVNYVPGDLIITSEAWNQINSDTAATFSLNFDYSTSNKQKQQITNFYAALTRYKLTRPYLILNIYDFRDKKYKHWYQWHTDKEFLAELRFPNSGLYIRKK